jgi:hypothetical protein
LAAAARGAPAGHRGARCAASAWSVLLAEAVVFYFGALDHFYPAWQRRSPAQRAAYRSEFEAEARRVLGGKQEE